MQAAGQGRFRPGWQDGAAWGAVLLTAYVAVVGTPAALAWILVPRSGSVLRELARGTALVGSTLLVLQFVLAGRFRGVDRPFGLDLVMRFHRLAGIGGAALLVAHPALLVADTGNFRLLTLAAPWNVNLGPVTLVLLALFVGFTLLFRRLGVDYRFWRFSHKLAIIVVALGFTHGLATGFDLRVPGPRAAWLVLFGTAAAVFAYRNIWVPLRGRRVFRVTAVRRETPDVHTVAFEPADDRPFPHAPGQFWFLDLKRPGRPSEEHHFTISSSPTGEPPLTSTIKASGDFTATIGLTRPGDRALVEGPFGRFSFIHREPPALVFIAGGVGITPILSMLRYLRDTGDRRPAVLVYASTTEDDIIRRGELDALPGNVTVVYVLSDPPEGWQGAEGFVDADLLREYAAGLLGKSDVYLCGPPPMMKAVGRELRALGVPRRQVHSERFAL